MNSNRTSPRDVDEQFRRFCRDGDTEALGEVFSAVAPWLTRRGMQLLRDPASAMDLVQATFVTAIETRDRFDPQAQARPWLRGILENKARRQLPSRTKAEELVVEPGFEDCPLDAAARSELASLAAQGIERLPEPYRSVLQRALLREETAEQIAVALGRSQATVRSQVQRGMERLRRSLPMVLGALLRAFRGSSFATKAAAAIVLVGAGLAVVLSLVGQGSVALPAARGPALDSPQPIRSEFAAREPSGSARSERAVAAGVVAADSADAAQPELCIEVRRAIDGAMLADVELVVDWADGEPQRVVTDERGVARVTPKAAARSVVIAAPFTSVRTEFELAAGTPATSSSRAAREPSVQRQTVELEIPPGFMVTGKVVDADGRPMAGATLLRVGDPSALQVGRSDAQGRFLVLDLQGGRQHQMFAVRGALVSETVTLVGTSGTTLSQDLHLDHPLADAGARAVQVAGTAEAAGPLTIEFEGEYGYSVHGWLAVLLTTTADDAVAVRPIVGNTASFAVVPAGALRCALVPANGSEDPHAIGAEARILTLRHGSVPRLLERRGEHAVFTVRGDELPSAWLQVAKRPDASAPLARRLVLLDPSGRPHGVFSETAKDIGPVRPGSWLVALVAPGHETEYRGPMQVESGGRYLVDDLAAQPAAILQLRGVDGAPMLPRLTALWLCAAEAIVLLDPRREIDQDLRVAPGDYVLYWQQEGRACSRIDVHAVSGVQVVELAAPPGEESEFLFDYGSVALAERVATLDLVVRDEAGRAQWRERLHAPLLESGTLRVRRRFATPMATVQVVDSRGCQGNADLRGSPPFVRIEVH